jgi:FkbM family methyltransferase
MPASRGLDVVRVRVRLCLRHLGEAWRAVRGKPPRRDQALATVAELRDQLAESRALVGRLATHLADATRAVSSRPVPSSGFDVPSSVLAAAGPDPVVIVDVGARELESEEHVYAALAKRLPSRVVGFEPFAPASPVPEDGRAGVFIVPKAVGSGRPATFRETRFVAASSLLPPNLGDLAAFLALPEMLEVVATRPVETVRLDDVPEVAGCQILKLDIQGGELDVLRGATATLATTLMIFVEVEFVPVYVGQPLFPEVHAFLEGQGFELLDLIAPGYGSYRAANHGDACSRLLWANGLYVRRLDPTRAQPPAELVRLACAAHDLAGKYDYAAHVLACCDAWHGTRLHEPYRDALHAHLAGSSA